MKKFKVDTQILGCFFHFRGRYFYWAQRPILFVLRRLPFFEVWDSYDAHKKKFARRKFKVIRGDD